MTPHELCAYTLFKRPAFPHVALCVRSRPIRAGEVPRDRLLEFADQGTDRRVPHLLSLLPTCQAPPCASFSSRKCALIPRRIRICACLSHPSGGQLHRSAHALTREAEAGCCCSCIYRSTCTLFASIALCACSDGYPLATLSTAAFSAFRSLLPTPATAAAAAAAAASASAAPHATTRKRARTTIESHCVSTLYIQQRRRSLGKRPVPPLSIVWRLPGMQRPSHRRPQRRPRYIPAWKKSAHCRRYTQSPLQPLKFPS